MKKLNTKGGFTLIELLVVVLIIGILSSIALPQYTKAVEKSRATEAFTFLSDWVNAQAIYKMTTGHYAKATTQSQPSADLDITLPSAGLKYFTIADSTTGTGTPGTETASIKLTRNGTSTAYSFTVTMTNQTDGSDSVARVCGGTICGTLVNGLKTGTGTVSGAWTTTATP